MVQAQATERWGDFVLAQDKNDVTREVERPGARRDLQFTEDTGPFDSRFSRFSTDQAAATADSRVPLLGKIPPGEQFLGYTVVSDGGGAGETYAHYLKPELRTIQLWRGTRQPLPDDASIIVGWSTRRDVPFYIVPLTTPAERRNAQLQAAAVFLDRTEKVEINGHKGVMRFYVARKGGSTYPFRTQSIMINWFEGDVLWTFASYFLTPQEAIEAAQSIRPTTR